MADAHAEAHIALPLPAQFGERIELETKTEVIVLLRIGIVEGAAAECEPGSLRQWDVVDHPGSGEPRTRVDQCEACPGAQPVPVAGPTRFETDEVVDRLTISDAD